MNPLTDLLTTLKETALYRSWREHHPSAYPSHFFCLINSSFQARASWEVGYLDPSTSKITVFVPIPTSSGSLDFEIKPEDDVFREPHTAVEELLLSSQNISFEQAVGIFFHHKDNYFKDEKLHNGFVTLQTINKQLLWNFTFITEKLRFANLKISADTGEIIAHQLIDLLNNK